MICYIDSSVVLRTLLNNPEQFTDWAKIRSAGCSELLVVECNRVLDRYRLLGELNDTEIAAAKENLNAFLRGVTLFELNRRILEAAGTSFSTVIGTLDAIHLSTALLWQKREKNIYLLTFDDQLRTAARASGLTVAP